MKMNRKKMDMQKLTNLFASLCLMFLVSLPAHALDTMRLFVGQVKVMEIGKIDRVAVGNGKLISTTILENGQLIVLGESIGITDLHIWSTDGKESHYRVTITKDDTGSQSYEVKRMLEQVPGVQVKRIGDYTVIEGEVDERYQSIISAVSKKFDGVMDLTRQADLSSNASMIYMNVKITEFNTSKLEQLGIEWDSSINGPSIGFISNTYLDEGQFNTLTTATNSTINGLADDYGTVASPMGYFGLATYITSRINFLVSSGDAMILAEPRLSARSGGKADFLAGGEIPIPVTDSDGQTSVEYKKYGISLAISPTADSAGNIQANIETEVSAIDSSTSVGDYPGFLTRKTNSDVSMSNNETLVISGLVNRELSEDIQKIPVLGDLPVIGALFRSSNYRNKKSELVIFVTPSIYDAKSQINKDGLSHQKKMVEEFMSNTSREIILD